MMKKFKKISAVLGATLLAGLTFGSAAMFPAPFVQNGVADVAIVHGTGVGVSSLDQVSAGNIQSALADAMPSTGGTVVVDGGEAFMLDKDSNHFNLGNALNAVYPNVDGDQLDSLADGNYNDGDIDADYSQKITFGTTALGLFADSDYMDKDPTIGFHWSDGDQVLNYTIDFDDVVNYTEMVGTNLPLLGKTYYVTAASSTQIDVLDSADSKILNEGETVTTTVDGVDYTVSVSVYTDGARFNVNGVLSDKLSDGEIDEIGNDVYVVAKSVDYVSKDSGTSQVEFAIGKGKIELISGQEAKLNGDRIRVLETVIGDNTGLDSLTLMWKSYRDIFLTEEDSVSMPTLGAISLAFGGMDFPADSEMISVDNGDTLTLNMGNYDLPIAYNGSAMVTAGEENHELKLATGSYKYSALGFLNETTWWGTDVSALTAGNDTVLSSAALNMSEDQRFLVTNIQDDVSDIDTAYYEISLIDVSGGLSDFTVELNDMIGSNDMTFDEIGGTDDSGDLTFTLVGFSADNSSALFEVSASSGTATYNEAVSEKGMVVTIPTTIASASYSSGQNLLFTEASKDDDVHKGTQFLATVKVSTNDKLHVSTYNLTGYDEEESSDHFIGYVPSDLASKITYDTSADENDFSIDYYGEEVTADVQVVTGGDVSVEATSLGNVLVKDTEVSAVKAKNLIVVGGSCINSVAAELLNVPTRTCGDAFTAATGVGSGQFLIQSMGDAYTTGKVAVVVAGYSVDDTTNAATYLRTQDVDTTAGKKYIGTSATQATII